MKILIIHLSDIHFKENNNRILEKKENIFKAFQNYSLEFDEIFIIISGDIAFSGKSKEYDEALIVISFMLDEIKEYSNKKANIIMVPGNHDCDYEIGNKAVRETLINGISGNKNIDNGYIKECCCVQNNYFNFQELCEDKNVIFKDELLRIIQYKYEKYNIIFNCYNTAWMSLSKNHSDKMYFPIERYSAHFDKKADIVISVLHHPLNYQNSADYKSIMRHLENTSDIILTGHEHVSSKYVKSDLDRTIVQYIEGDILQDNMEINNSGFNVIQIDLMNTKQKILNYKWNNSIYSITNSSNDWKSFNRSTFMNKKEFEINKEYEKYLNDPGATFTHPNKTDLILEDIFVFPDLKDLKVDKVKEKEYSSNIINSEFLCEINKTINKTLLIGAEKSGKSSLAKILYKKYYARNYIPVIIDGRKIKNNNIEGFNKLLAICFGEQYLNNDDSIAERNIIEKYNQLENNKKYIIIDNFDKMDINKKIKSVLFNDINRLYPNIIILTNELYKIEEIVCEEEEIELAFNDFSKYEIQGFGYLLRSKMINKWNVLGQTKYPGESELFRKNSNAEHVVNTIIGRNLVPSFPIFILTILQSIEVATSHDFTTSSYGHYYEYLIFQALTQISKESKTIDAYINYITELAYCLFKNNNYEMSKQEIIVFNEDYRKKYAIKIEGEDYLNKLSKASILKLKTGLYSFRYRYIYYFFISRYISNNISKNEIKITISKMAERLYVEEFANIIIFLIHLSKDPYIFNEILGNAKILFSEINAIKFNEDINVINMLADEVPKLVLESKTNREAKEENLKKDDKIEYDRANETKINTNSKSELDEDIRDLNIISKLNLSFKTIEILGQILKNLGLINLEF